MSNAKPKLSQEELYDHIVSWAESYNFPTSSLNNLYFFKEDGSKTSRECMPCLGSMSANYVGTRLFFFTTHTYTTTSQDVREQSKRYLEFQTQESLFKDYFAMKDPDWIMRHKGIIVNTDFPAHAVFSACQSIRYVWDKEYIIQTWTKMLEHTNPIDAFFLAAFFQVRDDMFMMYKPDGYHSMFNSAKMNKTTYQNYRNFVFSEYGMKRNPQLFSQGSRYSSGNYLFTEYLTGAKNYLYPNDREIDKMLGNPFFRPPPQTSKCPVRAFLEINNIPIEWRDSR